jgi:hypothetical protein
VLSFKFAKFVSFPSLPSLTTYPVVLLTSSILSITLSPAATLALAGACILPADVTTLLFLLPLGTLID